MRWCCAARAIEDHSPDDTAAPESNLVQRLEALIEAHFRAHWRVADYARALSVSPTHLSRVARTTTGASAQRLIEARLMHEARRNLAYTHLGMATIAYTLGYTDPAYFSRAFTRDAGLSPRAFRAQVAASAPTSAP
ncbi:helix-turn-helix domain-containing protein [Acidovorax sp.]|uniref:helix-turn-helix domain-containing protein n=1 Tax=Acidovorax sp. TaxID=1872122 RepID=UPI002625BA2F|nr:helix-turn-helix domain-containing protein [Acidovorax sp.]